MIFKAAFAYALLRGLLDSLARRPNPKGRYLWLKLGHMPEVQRLVVHIRADMQPATEAMRKLANGVEQLSRSFKDLADAKAKGA